VGKAEGYEIRLMGPRETRAYGVALEKNGIDE